MATRVLLSYGFEHPSDEHAVSDAMAIFENRRISFSNWPLRGIAGAKSMAASGFFRLSEATTAAQCFCCRAILSHWTRDDCPADRHRDNSPSCSWNNDTYMYTFEERLLLFQNWPIHEKPAPNYMAATGFWHSDKSTDEVTYVGCGWTRGGWSREDDPLELHKAHGPCGKEAPPTPPQTPPMITPSAPIPRQCDISSRSFRQAPNSTNTSRRSTVLLFHAIVTSVTKASPLAISTEGIAQKSIQAMGKFSLDLKRVTETKQQKLLGGQNQIHRAEIHAGSGQLSLNVNPKPITKAKQPKLLGRYKVEKQTNNRRRSQRRQRIKLESSSVF